MRESLETDILYTTIYIAILCIMLWQHQRKINNRWGVGSVILLSYIIYPIIGAFWFFEPIPLYISTTDKLKLFPFLYLALMLWIAVLPILRYDRQNINKIQPPTMAFLNCFAIIYTICALMRVPEIIPNISNGIRMLLTDSGAGAILYSESQILDSSYTGVIHNLPAIIFNIFAPLSYFLFFYYLSLGKKYRWAIIGFVLCILIQATYSLSNGQRTSVTMAAFNIIVSYVMMKGMLSERAQTFIRTTIIAIFIIISIPFMALTTSRFEESQGGVSSSVAFYIGEAPYIFNTRALDANGIRYGDRTSPIFKKILGLDTPGGIFEVRDTYPEMRLNDSLFSTFVGDFVLDYGPIVALMIFVIFCYLFSRLSLPSAPNQIPFHRAVLVYFAMTVCMQGGMYLFSYAFTRNLSIIAVFVFYIFFAIDYTRSQRAQKNNYYLSKR